MISRRIKGCTNTLGKPKGWDVSIQGNCVSLDIRVIPHEGSILCESAWEPTPEELQLLNSGGSLVLRIFGGQPPVQLYVEPQ